MHRLLIVPDSLIEEELGPSFLDRALFRVRVATSGREAMAIAMVWKPELILFSSTLPDMGAGPFSRAIRGEVSRDIKLFLLTDTVEPNASQMEIATDAQLVIPTGTDQILLAIAALLEVPVRQARRVPVLILSRVEDVTEDPSTPGTIANILNLSEHGVRLESPCHLRIGAMGKIHFILPGSDQRLTLGILVQVLLDEIQLHYGITFLGIAAPDGSRVRTFVEERLGAPQNGGE